MTKHLTWIALMLLVLPHQLRAQERCGTVPYNQMLQELAPSTRHPQLFEKWIQNRKNEREQLPEILRTQDDEIYTIPVVVHVVHNGESLNTGVNIPEAQILSQISVLNEDYRRLNFDTIYTPEIFLPVAADTRIQFKLAERDPNGGITSGIVRVRGTQSAWNPNSLEDDRNLKALSYWPPEDYLNIWVTNLTGSYLGYAQYPETSLPGSIPPFDPETDGVVIDYTAFGSVVDGPFPAMRSIYDRGRTTTHEVGHFLGLRHIWGDGGCGATDYCADTPDQESPYDNCEGVEGFSCGSPDMYQNYMDYSYDVCMNIFTGDQMERMRIVLENSPRRASLLNSPGLLPPDFFANTLIVRSISSPGQISCSSIFRPELMLQNIGINTIDFFEIELILNDELFPLQRYDRQILPGEQLTLDISDIAGDIQLEERQHYMQVRVVRPNGDDTVSYDNQIAAKYFLTNSSEDIIPLREKVEALDLDDLTWGAYNPDNAITWEVLSAPATDNGNRAFGIEMYNYLAVGERDWLVSPLLDFSEAPAANMTFDFSYAQRDTIVDLLEVKVSLDCGATFPFTVLQTDSEALAATSSSSYWAPSGVSDWQKAYVDLEAFAGEPEVRLAFITVNGYGNNLYLDNIELFVTDFTRDISLRENAVLLHPNPSIDGRFYLTVKTSERQPVHVRIVNARGQSIIEQTLQNVLNQTFEYDLSTYSNGVYVIQLSGNNFHETQRMLIYK